MAQVKQAWATLDKEGFFPYVDIFNDEQEARDEIGKIHEDILEIIDVLPGFIIVNEAGMCLDNSADFYKTEDEAKEDLKRLTSSIVLP